jgi:hypothetical protein
MSENDSFLSNDPSECFDNIIKICRRKEIESQKKQNVKELIYQCILSLPDEVNTSYNEEQALSFLEGLRTKDNRKLIAVCLLRLVAEPELKWLTDKIWRIKLISFFDSQFEEDLYSDRKIDIKLLGHEKMDRLVNIVKEIEKNINRGLGLLTSFEQMNTHRRTLMNAINSKIGRLIVHPFLPTNIEALLNESYKRTETYLAHREDVGVLEAYLSAKEEIENLLVALRHKGTMYSLWLADGIGAKLFDLLKEDFLSNKAAQPANILVEMIHKKYPFHLVGHSISLSSRLINQGPGYAYDTRIIIISDDNIELLTEEINLGRLSPGKTQSFEIPCRIKITNKLVSLCIEISWKDFDGTLHSKDFSFDVQAQNEDVEWQMLSTSDPYSLEAVSDEEGLIGRRDLLDRLIGTSLAPSVGSSLIQGQKRVGKTSIAKALLSHLEGHNYIVVYLESGDYVEPTGRGTVTRLGKMLCKAIKDLEIRIEHLPIPSFEDALSPLVEFLDDVKKIIPERRLVIVLDEFDQLPFELYSRGPIGNAFFLTLRSITSRRDIGFVLVGGERMSHILDCQGDQLNKWGVVSIDYFSRETDWPDFVELVRRPVTGNIEFTEDALNELHDVTAGNPYFTKLVCKTVLAQAISKRDCYVTTREINEGVKRAVEQADKNTFQHFWEDGIVDLGDKGTEKSIRRRKLLLALSDVLLKEYPASSKSIQEHPILRDLPTVSTDLREFVSRKILLSNAEDKFEFKVPLLQFWLKGKGVHDVITTFPDLDASIRERQKKEESKIRSPEIMSLVRKWGHYRGQAITEDNIRSWLEQFGDIKDQRVMFKVLTNLRYYSNSFVREKMTEVDGIVRRKTVRKIDRGKFKRSDILVSYMDGPAKSGAHFARLYADEAKIYVESVVEKSKIGEALKTNTDVQAVVFVDDFVGTGQSAIEYLNKLSPIILESTKNRDLKFYFVAVVAYIKGWRNLEKALESLCLPIEAYVCEILTEEEKCFGEKSTAFPDQNEKEYAKKVALVYGKEIVRKNPLGYGDLELAVVFERGCPNNSLPILWSESQTPKWIPLFKRD